MLVRKILLPLFFFLFYLGAAKAQEGFSIGTDIGLLRNMGKDQQFFSVGQTLFGNYHFTPRHSFYGWFMYFLPGKFSNEFTAQAKDPATVPQQISYKVNASWSYREISLGYKYYFKGEASASRGYNLYGMAGLGLMFAKSTNSTVLDTTLYELPVKPLIGDKSFARLNLDLGAGAEFPVAYNLYIYSDLRTWVNTSSYPVEVFHSDDNATLMLSLHVGMRILFN